VHTWGIQGVLGSIQTYKIGNCSSFEESAEIISRVAFKMFLGIRATVSNWNNEYNSCSIMFEENPLAEYVELPPEYSNALLYSNMLCGVIRGALEMVSIYGDATHYTYAT